ncbi:hypothetical protein RSOL_107910 [Rhizoctonia solani AG-3 Rhs1AP]|uniref:F-box domain-containing protein n=1 Tax=Rhizoctonia solani AG-3 Rhs1AP TaxID=1086054 RepID=X8IZU3_9AGAM|nr:hypothetical protein RSOL_107910 [Rhizoctonia solani AG-3 Rhs1AP]
MAAVQVAETGKSGPSKHPTRPERKAPKLANGYTLEEGPPLKRVKTTQVRIGGKASLSRLLDMPPELFNEVAIHLLPMDLLSLARSNKFFRKLLMSRTSLQLWQQALGNAPEIPSCPPELSEPQYISLIFSKTCSSCGARVLRRMDPYLHVRLCNSCRDEQTMDISAFSPLLHFLPRSKDIKDPRYGVVYTLESEFLKFKDAEKQQIDKEALANWQNERYTQVCKRQEHGILIEAYLTITEEERVIELDALKCQRQIQIETRLEEEGWSKRDMDPSPANEPEWSKLTRQSKLITDRTWTNLYPKLVPLLESNRTYNERADKETRLRERTQKLYSIVSNIRHALPPLVHLTLKPPAEDNTSDEPGTPTPTVSSQAFSNEDYPDFKAELPFPTMAELLTWPMIKRLVDTDTSSEDLETNFEEIRDEFDQAVVEWREKIERDLVEIWNANQDEVEDKPEPSTSRRRKGKQNSKAIAQKTSARVTHASNPTTVLASHTPELVLPEFVATYTKLDGTTTTNISDLHPNLQLLLRADTIFSSKNSYYGYPGIVPQSFPFDSAIEDTSELMQGERWDSITVKRDDEAMAVAKELLARVGRSEASSSDMVALGLSFRCGRCNGTGLITWGNLVRHYATEQSQWRRAQEKLKAEPKSGFSFNNTHDLEPGHTKPVAHFVTFEATLDYQTELRNNTMMVCTICEKLGIRAEYLQYLEFESPIKEHLRDVHGVMAARCDVHFRNREHDVSLSDAFDSNKGSEGSE